jgi:hypothetical protein
VGAPGLEPGASALSGHRVEDEANESETLRRNHGTGRRQSRDSYRASRTSLASLPDRRPTVVGKSRDRCPEMIDHRFGT